MAAAVGTINDEPASAAELLLTQFSASLSSSFPLPFRILVLSTLGLTCWALNLHLLHILGIDTSRILDVRNTISNEHVHPSRLYRPVYQLAGFYIAWTTLCWVIGFKWLAGGVGDSQTGRWVAAFSWVTAVAFLLLPVDKLKRTERFMFLRALKRTALDSITRPVAFCDVILADILTSYAKVLGDIWVCFCTILGLSEDGAGYKDFGVPFMTALPYLFRFKQCIAEYLNTPWDAPAMPSHNYRHIHQPSVFMAPTSSAATPASPKKRAIFNALKYASAFPVIIFSAMQSQHGDVYNHPLDEKDHAAILREARGFAAYVSPISLFRIWVLSVLVNSLYSFWWDVTNDWGLHMLLPSRYRSGSSNVNQTVLRRTILLPDAMIYYLCIALDLVLRLTWSLKLSSHLHAVHEIEMGIFMLEALEVVRRWIWVYLRVEWEAVRKGGDLLEERLAREGGSNASSANLSPTASMHQFTDDVALLPTTHNGPPQMTTGANLDRRTSGHRKGPPSQSEDALDSTLGRSGRLADVPKVNVVHSSPKKEYLKS